MIDQHKLDCILEDVRGYFAQTTPDNQAHNEGLARELIARYGNPPNPDIIFLEGFLLAVIVDDLRSATNALGLTYMLNSAMLRMGLMMDFSIARGSHEATVVLASVVTTSSDEDIRALAAILLSSPHFANNKLAGALRETYRRTDGTSCKIAIALSLFQCDDEKPLNEFIQKGYLPDFRSAIQKELRGQDARNMQAHMLMPYILKYVIEDCGTEGRGFDLLYNLRTNHPSLPWSRKIYND